MSARDDSIPTAPCPVANCDAPLYLTITSCIPIYTVEPPWPGAGEATYKADDAASDGWEIECTNGHKIWNHVDQIRAANARITDPDSEDFGDETGDTAPLFEFPTFAQLVLGGTS